MAQITTAATVTFLFTDLSGSTEILERLGDEAAQSLWHTHFELLRQAVSAHGGTEVKSLGDGLMVAFPSALSAVAAAVAMQQATNRHNRQENHPPLRVRVGLHAGEPIRANDDYFGASIVIARRLCDISESDRIYVSVVVRGLIGNRGSFKFRSLGPLTLKGLGEPVSAFEVLWEPAEKDTAPLVARETAPLPIAPRVFPPALQRDRRSPFVGRERELAQLTQRLEAAQLGESAVVLIAGEPGVGKTRLVLELGERAQAQGWQVLFGHAYESEGMPPYLPFIEALQEYIRACPTDELRAQLGKGAAEVALLVREVHSRLPDLPPSPSLGPDERYRLFESVCDFLLSIARSAERGLLLCLEDLHWADDATLLLLEHVVRRLARQPLLIVGTYRNTDLDVARPLARTLEQLMRQRLGQRLDVKRLPKDEVGAMLAVLAGQEPTARFLDVIFAETEGNPFFVQEVYEHLAEEGRLFTVEGEWRPELRIDELDVPQGVRLVIGRRLQRVSEECRNVLSMASVIGRSFSYELLSGVARMNDEDVLVAIEEAERAHLFVSDPSDGFAFAHELIRQTLLSGLSLPRRLSLHQRIAETMEVLYAPNLEPHLAELSSHYRLAGSATDMEKAIAYSVRAAKAASALFAYAEAVIHLEGALQALELAGVPDDARRCDLLLALAAALLPAGEPLRAAEVVAEEAFGLAEALGDRQRAARACWLALEGLQRYRGMTIFGTPVYQQWTERADRYASSGTVDRVRADIAKGQVLDASGRPTEGRRMVVQALELARQLGDPEITAFAGFVLSRGFQAAKHQEERLRLAVELTGLALDGVTARTVSLVLWESVDVFLTWGRREPAEALLRELQELGSRTHEPLALRTQLLLEAQLAAVDGHLETAVALGDEVITRAAELGSSPLGREFVGLTRGALLYLGQAEAALDRRGRFFL